MKKPNIILINCDDLGYGDLGCTGAPMNQTPCLDRMADEGIRFTSFYMASSVCSPSRAAMLTGCYPQRIGFGDPGGRPVLFPGMAEGLHPNEVTIARMLKEQGYATQMVGKWHCGDQPAFLPTRHGFDHYYGIPYSNDMGRQHADDTYPPLPLVRDERVIQEQPEQSGLTERYVEECVRFMRAHAQQPFFLYLAHVYVHLPIYVQDRFMRESSNGRYGAAVACIDWATGVILDELKALGLDENTLVIFTSDNGSRARDEGGSNGPLRGTKATTWEGGMRVPCIMRWPGHLPAGGTCEALTTAMDLLPTLAELCGGQPPSDRIIDGQSLWALMESGGHGTSPHEVFFYHWRNTLEAVRDVRWKLHLRKRDEIINELYDLIDDPGETRNVYAEHPDVVARLMIKVERYRADLGDEAVGVTGQNVRPIGRVDHPEPLTQYDPDHPYIMALYDLKERG